MYNYTDLSKEKQVQEILNQFRSLHLDGESIDNVKTYLRYIAYRKILPENSFNFRIHGEKELADRFIELLMKYTRPESSETHAYSIKEQDLLNMSSEDILKWKKSVHLLLIYDCKHEAMTAKDRQEWLRVCDCFEQMPEVLKILSAPDEVMQKRFYEDPEIQTQVYYGHFSQRIHAHAIYEDDVLQMIYERLDQPSGNRPAFTRTEEFNQKLEQYIYTVYKKADRQEETFVDDMIKRIINVYLKKDTMDFVLDGSCIPYYVQKQDTGELKTVSEPETAKEPKKTDKQPAIREENLEISVDTEGEDENNNPVKDCESDELNLLITSVSLYTEKNKGPNEYVDTIDENKPLYQGYMTNEAPITSLIHRLKIAGKRLDRIIYIESGKVSKKKIENLKVNGNEVTSAEYLRKRINNHTQKEEELCCVAYDKDKDSIIIKDEPSDKEVSEAVFGVYNRILELAGDKNDVNIYIESNGGIRYVLTMLLSVTKALEKRNKNIHIKEISSMVYSESKTKPTEIVNTKKIYDTAQITGIVDEFLYYGRVESLKNYAEELKESISEEEKDDIDIVLNKLSGLADDLQLCRTSALLVDLYGSANMEGVERTEGIGNVIFDYLEKTKETNSAQISIFRLLLEGIESDLDEVIYKNYDPNNKETIIYLPNIIEWCLSKNFVQQALTLCAERIPEYLFRSQKIRFSNDLEEVLGKNIKPGDYERYYYYIAHFNSEIRPFVRAPYRDAVIQKIKLIDEDNGSIFGDNYWKDSWFSSPSEMSISTDTTYEEIANDIYNKVKGIHDLLESPHKKWEVFGDKLKDILGNDYLLLSGKMQYPKPKDTFKYFLWELHKQLTLKNNASLQSYSFASCFKQLLPLLVDSQINKIPEDSIEDYTEVINEIFDEEEILKVALINKYAEKQSQKFYIRDCFSQTMMMCNDSDLTVDKLQKVMYLYSLCKEQRNMSNHAYVSDDDLGILLNSQQLSKVIEELLSTCHLVDGDC